MRAPAAAVAAVALSAGCGFGAGGATDAPRAAPDAAHAVIDGAVIDAAGPPDARGPDAPPPDAAFTVDQCPTDYLLELDGFPGSRYRFVGTPTRFALMHDDCNDDHAGWTHLVVLDDMAEASAVGDLNPTSYSYVGAVQDPAATELAGGWYLFTGGAINSGWSPSNSQPNDGDGIESGSESLAVVASTGNMHDVRGLSAYAAVCECDGKRLDPTVMSYLPPP